MIVSLATKAPSAEIVAEFEKSMHIANKIQSIFHTKECNRFYFVSYEISERYGECFEKENVRFCGGYSLGGSIDGWMR